MNQTDKRIAAHVAFWLVILIVLVFIGKGIRGSGLQPDPKLYQVVLLANDQVFYGKLHKVNSSFPYLTDVYYLNPQEPALDKQGRPIKGAGQKFSVVKRGIDEIHQPTDRMYFSRENILYWENVGLNSLVARGIKADKEFRTKQAESAKIEKPEEKK